MDSSQVLVINCGSSSLKFALFQINKDGKKIISEGIAEALNQEQGHLKLKLHNKQESCDLIINDQKAHAIALEKILEILEEAYAISSNLIGVGHRVVHGGKLFNESVLIDNEVLDQIRSCIPLAPLHNPANIIGIEILTQHFQNLPQIAVFDTSFHQTLPQKAYCYALPYSFYEKYDVRKYGFHGTSHRYIALQAANYFNRPLESINIISAHLGNGASVAAISNGKSVDTSMGMTPLEGLVMGTRSGDIDPGIFDYLISLNYSPNQISQILNKESGLLGISGVSNDMRTVCENAENNHPNSQLALDIFCFRAAKHIAGMMVSLTKLDALVFTGGIGENSQLVREKICELLSIFNLKIDNLANNSPEFLANKPGAQISDINSKPILIIPTDEEGMIVEDTLNIVFKSQNI